jgi:hypothetical protein
MPSKTEHTLSRLSAIIRQGAFFCAQFVPSTRTGAIFCLHKKIFLKWFRYIAQKDIIGES